MIAIKWGILDGRALERGIRKQVQERVVEAGQLAVTNATERCPVDTGFLRSTIRLMKLGHYKFTLQASAFYAVFVHDGTRYMEARPFLMNAVQKAMKILTRSKKLKATGFVKQNNRYPKQ